MKIALKQAQKAFDLDEVPVGCVIVKDNKILAKSCNLRESKKSALAHAEILAISKANKKINAWRLNGCTMYVTCEPCPMCAGAILNSRIDKVVFGTKDPKTGAISSSFSLFEQPGMNHHPEILSGILEDECRNLLVSFFHNKRK